MPGASSRVLEEDARRQKLDNGRHPQPRERGRKAEAEANRQALRPIVDAVLTCARQNIALRGHRDDGRLDDQEPQKNDGNFRSLLRLMMRHGDGVLHQHLKTSARNATYTSKTTQNLILDSALIVVHNYIRAEVTDCFFSVLADETTDRAGREQLAIIFRYVTQEEGRWCVREDPVRVVDLLHEIKKGQEQTEGEVRMTGENIGEVIHKKVQELNLNGTSRMVGCGFDGAAAMASQSVGAAAVLKRANPFCDYYHCAMHALNLCVAACADQADIRACLTTVKALTAFFNTSAKRTETLQRTIGQVCPEQTRTKLVTLCTTRFVERHDAILCLCQLLPAVAAMAARAPAANVSATTGRSRPSVRPYVRTSGSNGFSRQLLA